MKIKEINDNDHYNDNNNNNQDLKKQEQEQIQQLLVQQQQLQEDEELNKLIYSNIFRHLSKGEMDQCIELIEKDHSLVFSTEDHYGMTVLHLASQKKMRRLVKKILDIVSEDDLIQTRFDIDKVDLNNNTALHYACSNSINDITTFTQQQQQGQQQQGPSTVNLLDQQVGQSNDINSFMYLHEKKSNRYSIVQLLLERGASSSIKNKMNLLPIHLVCKEIDFKVVELLIENGDGNISQQIVEPHQKVLDSLNFSLMFQSLQSSSNIYLTKHEKERNEKKKDIIFSKIDPNLKCIKNGPTCLHYSLSNLKKIKEITLSLLSPSSSNSNSTSTSPTISPNSQISQDLSNLERHPLIKLIKLLLQKSCKPNHIDESTGKTAYHQFIDLFPTEESDLIEFFDISNCITISQEQEHDREAILKQKQNEFKLLISNLIYSITRLFYQYKYDFTMSSVKSILESDKDIEETPLGQCCLSSSSSSSFILEIILNFLKKNQDVSYQNIIDSKNSRGQPPLFIACSYGNIKAVELLLENGADPNIEDKFGSTMLHESLMFKHYEIAKKLILCGADVNKPMSVYPQSTPLHIVASQFSFEMCNFLVEHGSLLNVFDQEKQTPKDIVFNHHSNQDQQDTTTTIPSSQIEELKDFFEFHIQINLIQISSFVAFRGDYKLKIQKFIESKERNSKIVEKYMNQIFVDNETELKLTQLVDNSNTTQIQIPLKEIQTTTKRIKIKSTNDKLFKYFNLYNQTFNNLLLIIQNRFKPSTTSSSSSSSSFESIEQFEKNYIKSIILLPNVLITSQDKNLDFIRDDDEIVVEFY